MSDLPPAEVEYLVFFQVFSADKADIEGEGNFWIRCSTKVAERVREIAEGSVTEIMKLHDDTRPTEITSIVRLNRTK